MRSQIMWRVGCVVLLIVGGIGWGQSYEFQKLDNRARAEFDFPQDKHHDINHLTGDLYQLAQLYETGQDFTQFAKQRNLKLVDDAVVVTLLPEESQTAKTLVPDLESYGVVVEAQASRSLRCQIPLARLIDVAQQVPGIGRICNLIRPLPMAVQGEGVELTNADAWHTHGLDGDGVKLAVIDGGFINLSAAQANGDIPATYYGQDYTGGGLESGSDHGTAVAEAAYETAPGADYYFYHIGDLTDLENAKDDLISQDVNVVNHSMGWLVQSYYDGTGPVCDIVADAINNDVVWCNAAGNSGDKHYRDVFTEAFDNFHDMDGEGRVLNFFGPEPGYVWLFPRFYILQLWMNWDDYPDTGQDYDLYLYQYNDGAEEWEIVASSTDRQDGDDAPVETIAYLNRVNDGKFAFAVKKYNATTNVDFTVFASDPIANRVYSSSMIDPAVYEDAVTVAAIARENYSTGPQEEFSSQGPTNDGRNKPNVAGPDNCNSFTYGYWTGTSQSSPYVAGVCALIRENYPSHTELQIRDYLYGNCAVDMGDPGFDYIYGNGRVELPDEPPIAVELAAFMVHATEAGTVSIEWSTASETNAAGFFIQRSEHPNTGFARIHDSMIPARGTATQGATYEYIDAFASNSSRHYRLEEVTLEGRSVVYSSEPVTQTTGTDNMRTVPFIFELQPNYPNPFNPATHIHYSLPRQAHVALVIYDVKGRQVRRLVELEHLAGAYSAIWNGADDQGRQVGSGTYLYQLTAGENVVTRKMVLMR